jgi:hydroxymethylpyrimidine pyrophosphatase-like HAD family hydrolase
MATQTYTAKSSDWQQNGHRFSIWAGSSFLHFSQTGGYPLAEDTFNGSLVREQTPAEDQIWETLFADPLSEDIFSAFASEARKADESDLWSLEDSGL